MRVSTVSTEVYAVQSAPTVLSLQETLQPFPDPDGAGLGNVSIIEVVVLHGNVAKSSSKRSSQWFLKSGA